jgi:Subtilase family
MATDEEPIEIKFNENEIVVDLNQLSAVQEMLESIPVSWEHIEKSPPLELALLTLGDLSNVRNQYEDAHAHTDLDLLISYLKDRIREDLPIGKNRLGGAVAGSPYTGGGWGGPYTGGPRPGIYAGAGPYTGGDEPGIFTGAGWTGPYTGGGGAGPYTGGGGAGPYTGGGGAGPYTGGGGTGPYTGGGGTGPYTGGDRGDPQWSALGGFPERRHAPAHPVKVGILDTRLFAHPDLAGRYLANHDALVRMTCTSTPDSEAHATFIAGVILQRAPSADLVVDHVLNAYNISGSSWDVATRMVEFADAGVAVLNISFGAATHDNQSPLVLTRAVEKLSRRNVVIVAAAGNHGPDGKKRMWPAASPHVVAVGAGTRIKGTDSFESASFSPHASWVNLLAPGEGVRSLYKADGYAWWNGTSFAAAAVSGAVAHLVETEHISASAALDQLRERPPARKLAANSEVIADIGPNGSPG